MLDMVLDILLSIPPDIVAVIALLVVGIWLFVTGGRFLLEGVQLFFIAIGTVGNALVTFLSTLLIAAGNTISGLIILVIAVAVALRCAFLLLGG